MKRRLETKLDRERIGRIVRARRDELNITIRQMTQDTGISNGAISRIENGKDVCIHTLLLACSYLDLRLSLQIKIK